MWLIEKLIFDVFLLLYSLHKFEVETTIRVMLFFEIGTEL